MIQQGKYEISTQKLLFIDAGVDDAEDLLTGIQPDIKIITLSSESDVILQISTALSKYAPIREITILSHAEPGQINFLNQPINLISLNHRADELTNWSHWLTDDAQLCIYGCRLAADEIGQKFIQTLAKLTNTEVASSSLILGNVGEKKNWDLDSFSKPFEVLVPFSSASIAGYQHTLAPTLTLTGSEVLESASSFTVLTYEVTLSEVATTDVMVNFLARSGTADENKDFNATSGVLTIAAGDTTGQIQVRVVHGDTAVEADESAILELYNVEGAAFAGNAQRLFATGVILDDDSTGEARALFVEDVELVENDAGTQDAVFNVKLSRPSATDLHFDYQTVNGSASAGEDYTATSGSLTILAGQTQASVVVPVIGDTAVEGDEGFSLLVRPQANSQSAIANGVADVEGLARIADDDSGNGTIPVLSVKAASVLESASSFTVLTYEVTLSEVATTDVMVNFLARSGTADENKDFNATSGVLTIAAGDTTGQIQVRVVHGDTAVEADESAILELFNVEGAAFAGNAQRLYATGVILNDDSTATPPAVLVSNPEVVEGDSGSQLVRFDVLLSRPQDQTITINYTTASNSATSDVDFSQVSGAVDGKLVFEAGQTTASVFVPVLGDSNVEPTEQFQLILSAPQGGATGGGSAGQQAQALIQDDDASGGVLPIISLKNTKVLESASSFTVLTYEVTLSRAATTDIQVSYGAFDGTATVGEDYFATSGILTIAAGDTTGQIQVRVVHGDTAVEPDESVILKLTSPVNAVFAGGAIELTSDGIIIDDDSINDPSVPSLKVDDITVTEGPGTQIATFVIDKIGATTEVIGGDFEVFAGTATAGSDFQVSTGTFSIAAGATSATIDVNILDDALPENTETFVLKLSNLTNAQFFGSSEELFAIGEITDTDSVAAGVSVNVGGNTSINEGSAFNRTITFSDGEDANTDGWTYSVDWGDGSAPETGNIAAGLSSFDIGHTFADGANSHNVSVTVTDEAGDSDTQQFVLDVNNVAPLITLNGDATVDEGSIYTLALGAITDPGVDTVVGYLVNWGDGTVSELSAADVLAAAGNFDHIYTGDASNLIINVDLVDEDGIHNAAGTFNLVVNNVAPIIPLINVDDLVVDEGAGFAEFVVRLSAPSSEVVSVIYNTSNGVAAANGDFFQAVNETLTFAAGETLKTVRIALVDDALVEQDEVFFLDLSSAVNAEIGRTEVSATIVDNDGATGAPLLSISNPVVDESIGEAVFVLRLDRPSTSTVTVDYATSSDTADATDYTPVSGVVSFGPGDMVQTVRVPITDDGLAEAAELFDLVLSNIVNATLLSDRGTATIDASDQSTVGLPLINVDDVIVDEGAGFAEFVVRLSAPSSEVVSVIYNTSNGVAAANGDFFQAVNEALTFAAGETLKTVRIALVDDALVEQDEVFFLDLSSAVNAEIGRTQVSATIVDNDGGGPDGVAVNPIANALIDEGSIFGRTISFSDGDDANLDGWSYSVDWGDGSIIDSGALAAGLTGFDIGHTFADGDASHNVSVTVTDEVGDSDTKQFLVDVNNVAPTIALAGNPSVDEGSTYTLALGVITDPGVDTVFNYVINWGDGSSTTLTAADVLANSNINHVFADGASNSVISVDLEDEDGNFTAAGTLNVAVNNVAPLIVLSGNATVDEGSTYTLALGSITDPGIDAVTDYVINWGDGTSTALTAADVVAANNVDHVYADGVSNPVISVDLVDEDGTHVAAGTLNVTVNNVAPTIALSGSSEVNAGVSYTLSLGTIIDPGDDTVTSYVVNWGDGSSDTFSAAGDVAHTYAAAGNNAVTVDLVDEDGTHVNAGTFAVIVNDAVPGVSVNVGGNALIDEGSIFGRTISFSDGNDANLDGWSYSVDWDDGSVIDLGAIAAGLSGFDIGHAFADGDASHNVSVTVTDDAGDSDTQQFVVDVNNVAPIVALSGDASVDEGSTYTLALGAITDPGVDAVTNYIINWGDGSSTALTAAEVATAAGNVDHIYADGVSNPLISVDLVDEDGTHIAASTLNVAVNNVAPLITLSGALEVNAGVNYTLNLGDIVDPGDDTVTSYIVNWGDGSSDTFNTAGDVTHTYATPGNNTITVGLIDEDGTHTNAGNFAVLVNAIAAGVAVSAGGNAVVDEGSVFGRAISFSDGEDANLDGWTFSVDWGDGSIIDAGIIAAGLSDFNIGHIFADGAASHNVSVTVTDEVGDSDTQQFIVDVNNAAPTVALSGAPDVNAGVNYILNLGAIVDPGDDTVTSYIVNWGDGNSDTFNTAGDVTHTYATPGNNIITVDLIDEDGTHTSAGNFAVLVNAVAAGVAVSAGGNAVVDEGSVFSRTISFSDDTDTNLDGWSYSVNWGDGSTVENGNIAAGLSDFNIGHTFADGVASHNVSVTVTDVAGDSDTQQFVVDVNNVAPTVALSGDAQINEGVIYTLNLGAVTDPGDDTVTEYIVDWGDGSGGTFTAAGNVTHTFLAAGSHIISVDLVDEDNTHIDAGSLAIVVDSSTPIETVRIGDAPLRVSRSDPNAWENAWTDEAISIMDKADYTNLLETWSSAILNGRNSSVLEGGDIFGGDLGVSGQSLVSSTIRQEIDGTEALRFDLDRAATSVTIDLARLEGDAISGNFESGRLQLLDDSGSVVDELVFNATALGHEQQITLDHNTGFTSVVLTAGAYNGIDFVSGGLTDASGLYQSDPIDLGDGTWNGSDYLVEAVEFEFGNIIIVGGVG